MTTQIAFYEYAACGTCKKARKWLDAHRSVWHKWMPSID